MNREDLIEAGVQALTDAWSRGVLLSQDKPGGEWHTDFGKFTATVLDAIEGKVRADERERIVHNVTAEWAASVHEYRADLRVKVEALPSRWHTRIASSGHDPWVLRADVLALFDGGSDD